MAFLLSRSSYASLLPSRPAEQMCPLRLFNLLHFNTLRDEGERDECQRIRIPVHWMSLNRHTVSCGVDSAQLITAISPIVKEMHDFTAVSFRPHFAAWT